MPSIWTEEKLLALEPAKLERLRRNAEVRGEAALVANCEAIQQSRKPKRKLLDPVVGFHFLCKDNYEVTVLPDGTFWSGVWVVSEEHCDPAIELAGYVALHESKSELSYRQGRLLGWKIEHRTKGKTLLGVSFLAEPTIAAQRWYGDASGERGYRRVSDDPKWSLASSK